MGIVAQLVVTLSIAVIVFAAAYGIGLMVMDWLENRG